MFTIFIITEEMEKRGREAWLYVKRSVQSLRIYGVDGNMWTNTPILHISLRKI